LNGSLAIGTNIEPSKSFFIDCLFGYKRNKFVEVTLWRQDKCIVLRYSGTGATKDWLLEGSEAAMQEAGAARRGKATKFGLTAIFY
jgi:hypothetical protein